MDKRTCPLAVFRVDTVAYVDRITRRSARYRESYTSPISSLSLSIRCNTLIKTLLLKTSVGCCALTRWGVSYAANRKYMGNHYSRRQYHFCVTMTSTPLPSCNHDLNSFANLPLCSSPLPPKPVIQNIIHQKVSRLDSNFEREK